MKTITPTQTFQWNVLYTKPGMEKKVADSLNAKHIKNYLPVKKTSAPWWSFKDKIDVPLFPSIVFVKSSPKSRAEIKQISGVVNFLYWLGNPAVIKDHEIATIKVFLSTHNNVSIQKTPIQLKYISDVSNDSSAIDKIIYSDEFKIDIPTLGYSMVAEGVSSNIRYIKTEKQVDPVSLNTRLSNAS